MKTYKRANFMDRNVNAEMTNKIQCQIYGLGYRIFLSVGSGIRLLTPGHDLYLQDVILSNCKIG